MSKEEVLDTLWARVAERGDFPTLQSSVRDIVHAMQQEEATTSEMAEAVLSDVTLTQKVIRLANSAMYAPFGGNVTTISQAIIVLGSETVGYLALGLQLLDNFTGLASGKGDAAGELRQALLAGEFARRCTGSKGGKDSESAVVCSMMHPLARLLVVFYFPDEWQHIKTLVRNEGLDESSACKQMLGVTLEEIAASAADKWGLPPVIAQSMKPRPLTPTFKPESPHDWLGTVARLSFQVAKMTVEAKPTDETQHFVLQYAKPLQLDEEPLREACKELVTLKRRLGDLPSFKNAVKEQQIGGKPEDAQDRLMHGLAAVRSAAQNRSVTEVLSLVLETLMQAMEFTHCLAFLLNPGAKRFDAKLGFGPDVRKKLPHMSFEDGFVPDVFHLACTQKKPIYIENAQEKAMAQNLPEWYRDQFPDSGSFLLVPVQLRGRTIALLYGDWGSKLGASAPDSTERTLLDQLGAEIAACCARPRPAPPHSPSE